MIAAVAAVAAVAATVAVAAVADEAIMCCQSLWLLLSLQSN